MNKSKYENIEGIGIFPQNASGKHTQVYYTFQLKMYKSLVAETSRDIMLSLRQQKYEVQLEDRPKHLLMI